jgi:hypothetical protein
VNVLYATVSGVVGTIVMIGVIYAFPLALGKPAISIPLFVGSLFSARPRVAGVLGTAILLFDGALIAWLGRLAWRFGSGAQGLVEGLALGAFLGLLSLVVMKVLLAARREAAEPPPMSLALIAFTLWLGHLPFGVCVALVCARP